MAPVIKAVMRRGRIFKTIKLSNKKVSNPTQKYNKGKRAFLMPFFKEKSVQMKLAPKIITETVLISNVLSAKKIKGAYKKAKMVFMAYRTIAPLIFNTSPLTYEAFTPIK